MSACEKEGPPRTAGGGYAPLLPLRRRRAWCAAPAAASVDEDEDTADITARRTPRSASKYAGYGPVPTATAAWRKRPAAENEGGRGKKEKGGESMRGQRKLLGVFVLSSPLSPGARSERTSPESLPGREKVSVGVAPADPAADRTESADDGAAEDAAEDDAAEAAEAAAEAADVDADDPPAPLTDPFRAGFRSASGSLAARSWTMRAAWTAMV
jgi:hypothetical protein